MEEEMYKFKVSIIMAVYNVEIYLEEAVDSVIKQDIGFENIQLILVDDGSKDNSGKICDNYVKKYPDNIVVVHKENGGVSSARNEGLKHVLGEYINFLDSDDRLSSDTIRLVCKFFDAHKEEIDLVAIPMHFFEGQRGEHSLNVKFGRGTRIIDLREEWNFPQLSFSCAFAKSESIEGMYFDYNLAYAEDAQLVLKVLCKKQKMGVVAEAKYFYRKRKNGEASAIQSSGKKKEWYLPYIEHFTEYSINFCKNMFGYVPKFVQNTLMYDLQWRFKQQYIPKDILNENEITEYKSRLFSVLKELEDEVILIQRSLAIEQKNYLLQLKHPDVKPKSVLGADGNYFYCFNNLVLRSFERMQTRIHFINLFSDRIEIQGDFLVLTEEFGIPHIYIYANGNLYLSEDTNYNEILYSLDTPIAQKKGFKISVPLEREQTTIELLIKYDSFSVTPQNIVLGKYCPISYRMINSYYYKDGYMLYPQGKKFVVEKKSKKDVKKAEKEFIKELLQHKDKAAKKAVFCRLMTHILKPFMPKNIWLIMDKADRADDNGEAFYLYCLNHKKETGCYPIFAVSKTSKDYKKLKKMGPVIPYMSKRHKIMHLLATHTISAYSHDEVSSPFFDYSFYYCDLMQNNKIVFLQHGITKDDVSNALNKNNKNFSLFITAAQPEYESIIRYNYGYSDNNVILTGFPRYDRLYDNNQRKITIMPTWRRKLFGTYNPQTSQWSLLPGFEKSDFYIFYSNLLNSEKLHEAVEKYNYKLQFLIHPILFPYLDHFDISEKVEVLRENVAYRDVFAESALVLTDYSSVAFDFAYLRKPVMYAHFDSNHYEEGYFNYETDGFGEVEYNLEDTIDRIIEYMKNGCQLKEVYRQRVDKFFAFGDKNNCQRVCDEIKGYDLLLR